MKLVLALDSGTTSVRTVAFGPSTEVLDEDQRPLTQYFPAPGEVEHDPAEITTLAVATLRTVAKRARARGDEVVAIGLTNQRETTVAFDRSSRDAPARALVWQDRRTAPHCAQLAADGYLDLVRRTTGLVLDPYFSGTKMRWLLDHGALDGAASPALGTIDTYLLWTLSGGPDGGVFLTESSNASRTMLYDLTRGAWSEELGELLGVPLDLLAPIVPSAGLFATIDAELIPELAGVPVCGVLGDQQAALFGQACFSPGMVKATYGTGAFVLATTGDVPPPIPDGLIATVAWDLGVHGPRTFALEGSAFVAGAAVQWLRDALGVIGSASELEALAATVTDSAGVMFVPAFTGLGSPFWRTDARGSLSGLSLTSSPAHLARAVLDAQSFQVRAMTDTFTAAGLTLRELRADGGVAVMDQLLQDQATHSRLVVRRSASVEATARGAATLAGLAAGVWHSLDELADTWRSLLSAHPENPEALDARYAAWLRAVERA